LRINDTIPNLSVETDHGTIRLYDRVGDGWAQATVNVGDCISAKPQSNRRGVKCLSIL
jgi:hypothetical protein